MATDITSLPADARSVVEAADRVWQKWAETGGSSHTYVPPALTQEIAALGSLLARLDLGPERVKREAHVRRVDPRKADPI